MKVVIAAPESWQPRLDGMRRGWRGPDVGYAILRLCQSSGLGVPVDVAYGFAAWLSGSGDGVAWDRLLPDEMLRHEGLTMVSALGRLSSHPFHGARLLLFPVAARVQDRLGTVRLLGLAGSAGDVAGYEELYNSDFRAGLDACLNGLDPKAGDRPDPESRAWRTAVTLPCLQFLRDPGGRDDRQPLPDRKATALFLGAAALDRDDHRRQKATPRMQRATTRITNRFQSDGIEGIRHAGPNEDPSAMLPSQMVYPPLLIVEKMANEGFVAYDRPPHLPEKHRCVICALPLEPCDGRLLATVRAAFWLAVRDVEADLARSPALLTFAWLPSGPGATGRHRVVHAPAAGLRMAAGRRATAWLQTFDGEGAPFLHGPRTLGRREPGVWPASPSGILMDADLPVMPGKRRDLRLHVCAIGDRPESEIAPALAEWKSDLAALDPEICVTTALRLLPEGAGVSFHGADPLATVDGFADAVTAVQALAEAWYGSIREVLRHG